MGLDMYAYKTKAPIDKEIDFELDEEDEATCSDQIHYWRKHPNLHGYMNDLYIKKGGTQQFNGVNVLLTEHDLLTLLDKINHKELPVTSGFFFGESTGDDEEELDDMTFIATALTVIEEGYKVYYSSWW